MRTPIIAGNWKMYKTIPEARELASGLLKNLGRVTDSEIILCPPFTALAAVAEIIGDSRLNLGAQDMYIKEEGAYTGEVSPLMLRDIGCKYVIIGHSERREHFGETDAGVNAKAKAALKHGLIPIICVGETLAQRQGGQADLLVAAQTRAAFDGIDSSKAYKIVMAYEPIWAIGTGLASDGPDANRVIGLIRGVIAGLYSRELAESIRILYGGSVKPENINEFMKEKEIDGALVGGASLKADSFTAIARYGREG